MKQGPQDKSKIWQRHLEAAESFAGSTHKYCSVHRISEASFYYWQKKIRARAKGKPALAIRSEFLPMIVSPAMTSAQDEDLLRRPFDERGSLPDARWAAEFVSHLFGMSGGAR